MHMQSEKERSRQRFREMDQYRQTNRQTDT